MFLAWCVVGIASKRVVIGDLIKMTVTVIMTVTVRHTHSAKAVWVGEDTDSNYYITLFTNSSRRISSHFC